jgi:hypothetical protein
MYFMLSGLKIVFDSVLANGLVSSYACCRLAHDLADGSRRSDDLEWRNILAYFHTARIVEPEKQSLLDNGCVKTQ